MTELKDTKRGTGFTCTCDITPPQYCPQHMDDGVTCGQVTLPPATQKYVVGFFFNEHRDCVLLIRKNKPDWQAGKLNGIGGKIEPGERAIHAMTREFLEETGILTQSEDWRQFASVGGPGFLVHFFEMSDQIPLYHQTTDEEVGIYGVNKLLMGAYHIIPNLRWLLPLAIDKDKVVAEVKDPTPQ